MSKVWQGLMFMLAKKRVTSILRLQKSINPEALKDKCVYITGGSSGIGEQLAYAYAQYGANVTISARREDKLKQVCEQMQTIGQRENAYKYVVADFSNTDKVEDVFKKVMDINDGQLDQLLLNHAAMPPRELWKFKTQDFEVLKYTVDTILHSSVMLASYAVPYLEKQSGSIAVLGSLVSKVGCPYDSSYSAAKFALEGFFQSLRAELETQNIDVSITHVTPIGVETDTQLEELTRMEEDMNVDVKELLKQFPLANASDCAHEIIRATTQKEREIYFPHTVDVMALVLLRDWFPNMVKLDFPKKK